MYAHTPRPSDILENVAATLTEGVENVRRATRPLVDVMLYVCDRVAAHQEAMEEWEEGQLGEERKAYEALYGELWDEPPKRKR